jgi:predicted GNAT family acetyltransferase
VSLSGDLAEAREMAERKVEDRDIYIWEDEKPVSMAAQVRPTSNGTSVSLVYTPPEFRQRGYATACVASVSQLLLDSGWKFCALFTNLANPASNRLYQNIGYRPVCDFDEYVFSTPPHR